MISQPIHFNFSICRIDAEYEDLKTGEKTWYGYRNKSDLPVFNPDGSVKYAGDALIVTQLPGGDFVIASLNGKDALIECYGISKKKNIAQAVNDGEITASDYAWGYFICNC